MILYVMNVLKKKNGRINTVIIIQDLIEICSSTCNNFVKIWRFTLEITQRLHH